MAVPPADALFVPPRVAWSVTAVLGGTEIVAPDCEPPDSDVDNVVGVAAVAATVSVSDPQLLVEPLLLLSPL